MKKIINTKFAGTLLISILSLLSMFHLLIIFKFIPAEFVWGSQINDSSINLLLMESIALAITLVFILIIALKSFYFNSIKKRKLINIIVWIVFFYFILNTLANHASDHFIERMIFTPLTLFMAFLTFRLAIER
ncbi:hypothetical protein ACFLTE_00230 [Bacteroidota bacterium]